jgi:hypothetical protein
VFVLTHLARTCKVAGAHVERECGVHLFPLMTTFLEAEDVELIRLMFHVAKHMLWSCFKLIGFQKLSYVVCSDLSGKKHLCSCLLACLERNCIVKSFVTHVVRRCKIGDICEGARSRGETWL